MSLLTEGGERYLIERGVDTDRYDDEELVKFNLGGPFQNGKPVAVVPLSHTRVIENPTREQVLGGEDWVCPNCRWANHIDHPPVFAELVSVKCDTCGTDILND